MTPFISVLIRSYNRLKAVVEILEVLLDQTYSDFEIVIVDQSDPGQWEVLTTSELNLFMHQKINLVHSEPLGSGRRPEPGGGPLSRRGGVVYG